MSENKHKLVIIGSGPAGYTAAIYAARANLKPLVITGIEMGGQLMQTTDVENYPGYADGVMGPKMMDDFRIQAERMGATIKFGHVTKVDFSEPMNHKITVDDAEEVIAETKDQNKLKYLRPLLALSIVAFVIMFNEGAVEHWSNLFLFDIVNVTEYLAGLGFIAFSLCMTLGRFLGDGVSKKYGSTKIISGGCIIAFFGYCCIVTTQLFLSIIGFGILGLGLSVIIPEIFRLAGKTKNIPASLGISIVSGVGFSGFLVGPVVLGFISNWADLTWSFGFLSLLVVLALFLTQFNLKKMYGVG